MVEVDIVNIKIITEHYILGEFICSHLRLTVSPGNTKEKAYLHTCNKGVYTTTMQNNFAAISAEG